MKIDGNELQSHSLSPLLQQQANTRISQPGISAEHEDGSFAGDSAAISPAASLASRTTSQPDLNAARVQELRQALADGSLRIDSGRTASALMQSMFR